MTVHAVVEKLATMSKDIDSLNRFAQCAAAVDNGNVVQLLTKSTDAGEGEVWVATAPASGSLEDLYMVAELGVVSVYDSAGNEYRGLNSDPRNAYNAAEKTFTAFQLHKGDVVRLTAEAFSGAKGVSDTFANAADGLYTLVWGTSQTASALSLRLLATNYISIGSGTLGATGRVVAYDFKVLYN
jgi:hypothetical protein